MTPRLLPTAHPAPARVRQRWRDRGMSPTLRLGYALEDAAESDPDVVALVVDDERVTLGQLRDRAIAIAASLTDGGVEPGDVVSWMLPNGVDAVATAAAIWRVGAVSNPIVTIYRRRELAFILNELSPRAVIAAADVRGRALCAELDGACADAGVAPRLRLCADGVADGWRDLHAHSSRRLDCGGVPASSDEVCLVLYTSGTTSDPKGVMHRPAGLVHEVASMQRAWGLTFRDAMLMASPLTHITGMLQGLLVPCLTGARSILMGRWDPEECVELIEREAATYMAGATPFLSGILDAYQRRGLTRSCLRQFCCGGAAVAPELIERAARIGIAAYRCWGMTELPTTTLASERDPLERRSRFDGRIAEGVEITAVDGQRHPLPIGEEGELRVRGPEQMLGYVDPQRSREAVDDEGWFYTGDVGVVDAQGWVRVTGRLKDIVNRGGEKFSTREIEDLLIGHPAVAEVAVVALPHLRLGEMACAVIVRAPGATADPDELLAFLRAQQIAQQKLPERFEFVPILPRTASGKVQKHLLVEELAGSRQSA